MAGVTVTEKTTSSSARDKKGKCLTFALGNEEYGLENHKVRRIMGDRAMTAAAQMSIGSMGRNAFPF